MKLTVASTNAGKIHEVRHALHDLSTLQGWSIEPLPPGLPDIEETGTTFLENAALKAAHYSRLVEGLTLSDDSGLCVHALGGRPGVYTARYGSTPEKQNYRVLSELLRLQADSRVAEFRCAFVVAKSGAVIWKTEAALGGEIAYEPTGDSGFGFDPIFYVPSLRKTLAQLTTEEKNRISARGQALLELRRFLTSL